MKSAQASSVVVASVLLLGACNLFVGVDDPAKRSDSGAPLDSGTTDGAIDTSIDDTGEPVDLGRDVAVADIGPPDMMERPDLSDMASDDQGGADAGEDCDADVAAACAAMAGECEVARCEPDGTCIVEPAADQLPCTDDGNACTVDRCDSGVCTHAIRDDSCFIDGDCYAAAEVDPTSDCRLCDPSQARDAFSANAGVPCDDGDGQACTSGVCDDAGVCQPMLQADQCLIGATCRDDGEARPGNECEICDPSTTSNAWSNEPDGTSCASQSTCTTGSCQGGTCQQTVQPNRCHIAGTCYTTGEFEPGNFCHSCVPALDATGWTDTPDGTTCGNGCSCQAGACLKSSGNPC